MTNFNDYLTQQMKDSAFKEAYEQLEPEFAIIQAIIDARKSAGITQKELSQKSGIAQGRYQQTGKWKCQSFNQNVAATCSCTWKDFEN